MKTSVKIAIAISALLLVTASTIGYTEDASATNAITKALHQYYQSMADRDVEALRGVLASTFIVIEASRKAAKTHLLNADDTTKLLPPEGNDDWQNLRLIDVKVSVSSTHPSVATVSYSVFHPISPDQLKALEEVLKNPASPLDESQRNEVSRRVADRGSKESECAMLVLSDGRWRIVAFSVPK
jgi:hypothetical protein